MHGIAGFVAGLVAEHTDNRLHAIVKALNAERILFFTIDSPLDHSKVCGKNVIFTR